MAFLKFKNTVKYKQEFRPAHVLVEVDDHDVPELLKVGAYDVKIEETAVFEDQLETEKPRKKGKK